MSMSSTGTERITHLDGVKSYDYTDHVAVVGSDELSSAYTVKGRVLEHMEAVRDKCQGTDCISWSVCLAMGHWQRASATNLL